MVCTTYVATSVVPAPVTSVTATKISETTTSDYVEVRATFGSGTSTGSAIVKLDGTIVQYMARAPNSSSFVNISVPNDGVAHQICVE